MAIKGLENISGVQLQQELTQGAKFVVYQYCISVVLMTFRRGSNIHYIRPGQGAVGPGLGYTLLALIFGWWGIPWGPIYTIQAVIVNFQGGKDVTSEVMAQLATAARQSGI